MSDTPMDLSDLLEDLEEASRDLERHAYAPDGGRAAKASRAEIARLRSYILTNFARVFDPRGT